MRYEEAKERVLDLRLNGRKEFGNYFPQQIAMATKQVRYYYKILEKWGSGKVLELEIIAMDMTNEAHVKLNILRTWKLLYANINEEDAKSLVKYKYPDLAIKTINIKELQIGDLELIC
jgi:hypothetical protein